MLHRTRTLAVSILVSLFTLSCGGGGDDGGGTTPTGPTTTQMGGARQGVPLNLTTAVTTLAGMAGAPGSADGAGTAARFRFPRGITTDGTNLYIADDNGNAIRRIVIATGVVSTLAGTPDINGSADGTGAAAQFESPGGITTDGANLYVADTNNHTIRQIVIATGVVTTLAGTAGSPGSADGTGPAARFNFPQGITTDGANLYVADPINHTVRQIVIATGVVTTLAGMAGSPGLTNAAGQDARFNGPVGVTTDGTNIYVTDAGNHSIRQIVIATGAVTSLAGAGSTGYADGTGTAALFSYPQGITTDGTNLYVADTYNETIRRVVIATGAVTTLAGTAGLAGSADGTGAAARFSHPRRTTTDGQRLFIVDTDNHTLRAMQ